LIPEIPELLMRIAFVSLAIAVILPACTFVKMAPGGAEVRVAAQGANLSACQKRGEIDVSVKDRLGPYEREPLRVRDELETLARNEAPDLNADTVQPKGPPDDGAQRFLAFRCAGAVPAPPADAEKPAAETVPLDD
jgi:hypothetical protein